MKRIAELTKYGLHVYFKGNKFIMPLVVIIIYQYTMYTIMPVGIVDSFVMASYLVFFVLVWTGLSVSADENPVMEQIQLLRVRSSLCYYLSRAAVLAVLGLSVSMICVLFPVIQNLLNDKALFLRPLTAFDVLNAFILVAGCSFTGGALGSLLHPRVMEDRKLAVVLTVLLSVLTVVRTGLVQEIPFFKYVAWILPPVDRIAYIYGNADRFCLFQTGLIFAALAAYGAVLVIIRSCICQKRKF
ncbi:hypothetical protein [Dorea sp. D27]|uniref:hypothetical protein n=1 Tax=Dorea sp. D27 TaxID=658665 RepID=UPI000673A356|nr:hypothetical protein [Dorea sp. D27]KMZ55602.1 hypothetical protein HMPREF0980_00300 [Dorea sp. D27]